MLWAWLSPPTVACWAQVRLSMRMLIWPCQWCHFVSAVYVPYGRLALVGSERTHLEGQAGRGEQAITSLLLGNHLFASVYRASDAEVSPVPLMVAMHAVVHVCRTCRTCYGLLTVATEGREPLSAVPFRILRKCRSVTSLRWLCWLLLVARFWFICRVYSAPPYSAA